MQQGAKIAIVIPAGERDWEWWNLSKAFQLSDCFQFPDRDLTEENWLTLCLFGFTITAHFGNAKHTLPQTSDHKSKE